MYRSFWVTMYINLHARDDHHEDYGGDHDDDDHADDQERDGCPSVPMKILIINPLPLHHLTLCPRLTCLYSPQMMVMVMMMMIVVKIKLIGFLTNLIPTLGRCCCI